MANGSMLAPSGDAPRTAPMRLRFDPRTHPDVAGRVAAWRDAMAPTVDLLFRPAERDGLAASLDVHRLGDTVLVDSRCTPVTMVRDRRTLARTGHTNVLLDLIVAGGISGTAGGQAAAAGPGDCLVVDLKSTFRFHVAATRYIGVVMPRAALAARCGGLAGLHGLHFPAASAEARLLAPLLEGAVAEAPRLAEAAAAALGQGLLALVGGLVAARIAAAPAPRATRPAPTAARVRRHIEGHAADPRLDAAALCAAFGLSRTALYRLLGADGGVAAAIRDRRIVLARRLLGAADGATPSVEAAARASGFGDARALRRALRAAGDAPPSRLRREPPDPEAGTREHRLAIGAWLDP